MTPEIAYKMNKMKGNKSSGIEGILPKPPKENKLVPVAKKSLKEGKVPL